MNKLHKQDLHELAKFNGDCAITIYVPMHTSASPPHITENQIRLKNLSHQAVQMLEDDGNGELANKLLEEVLSLSEDLPFWTEQTCSMLICASKDFIKIFNLPVDSEEYVALDNQFHLAPLLGLISDEQDFYVLELNEHNPKLLHGDMYGLSTSGIELPISYKEMNSGISDSTKIKAEYKQSGYPDRFFKGIDHIITEELDTSLPLILAGTATETAAYKNISHYPNIMNKSVTNSYDESQMAELYAKVKPIIDFEIIKPQHKSIIEEYLRLEQSSPDLTSNSEENLIQAAEAGRVDKLLTIMSRETSDNVQDSMNPATCITFKELRLNNLINKLALSVWQMKGMVLNLRPSEMPANFPIVAKLRY
jgi:hypothetical protein